MEPEQPLPYNTDHFSSAEAYLDSLLAFVSTNDLLRTFCGGVHVLDFFTSDPDLYSRTLPLEWREFFAQHEIMDLLDFFMREDLEPFVVHGQTGPNACAWRNGPLPPQSLIDYITSVRKHLLEREPRSTHCALNRTQKKLARHVSVGMNVKKVHEVGIFASYIDSLATASSTSIPGSEGISHIVDFGSGQSYLGRALASEPYNRNIVAIESKTHNTVRAKVYDVRARLVGRERVMRNKKAFRAGLVTPDNVLKGEQLPTPPPEQDDTAEHYHGGVSKEEDRMPSEARGRIQHIEHRIQNGDLTNVISQIPNSNQNPPNLMIVSLHSCGNLLHHGLRSLTLNPAVKAVALIGCCYNLLTERLGPATYKLPELRPTTHAHPRLEKMGEECDVHGFPMSQRFCSYARRGAEGGKAEMTGVRMNITARMMAVQAPANWGEKDSESFFTRHFYRAVLQRIFLDRGVVEAPRKEYEGSTSPAGHSSGGTPILIGSLRKHCYADFVAYVRAALAKLYDDPILGPIIYDKMDGISDAEINAYEEESKERKKDLSVVWSLMAFSAGVMEAAIVVDRWCWLREQWEEVVERAWVEPVWEYGVSPRNLVVVGIKR